MPDKQNKPFFARLIERAKPANQDKDRPGLPRLFGQDAPNRKPDLAKAKLVPSPERSPELAEKKPLDQTAQRPPHYPKAAEMRQKVREILVDLSPDVESDRPGLTAEDARHVLKAALNTLGTDRAPDFAEDERGVETTLTKDWGQRGIVRPGAYSYEAKVYFEPLDHGIGKGEVSKLEVRDFEGNRVADYDREWDLEPEPGSPAAEAVQQIVAFYRENAKDMPQETGAEIAEQAGEQAAGNSNPMGFFERSRMTPEERAERIQAERDAAGRENAGDRDSSDSAHEI